MNVKSLCGRANRLIALVLLAALSTVGCEQYGGRGTDGSSIPRPLEGQRRTRPQETPKDSGGQTPQPKPPQTPATP